MCSDILDLLERVASESKLTLEDAIEIGCKITRRAYEKIKKYATVNAETGKEEKEDDQTDRRHTIYYSRSSTPTESAGASKGDGLPAKV